MTFDSNLAFDREADFADRQSDLCAPQPSRRSSAAPSAARSRAVLSLPRVLPEAKAVLDAAIADDRPTAEDPAPLVLRAIANIMLGRVDDAQKDLANPLIGNNYDAPMWRALLGARRQMGGGEGGFSHVEGALAALPLELQRLALWLRCAPRSRSATSRAPQRSTTSR